MTDQVVAEYHFVAKELGNIHTAQTRGITKLISMKQYWLNILN